MVSFKDGSYFVGYAVRGKRKDMKFVWSKGHITRWFDGVTTESYTRRKHFQASSVFLTIYCRNCIKQRSEYIFSVQYYIYSVLAFTLKSLVRYVFWASLCNVCVCGSERDTNSLICCRIYSVSRVLT